MSDGKSVDEKNELGVEERQNDAVFKIVYLGFVISGLIALLVVGGVIFISVTAYIKGGGEKVVIPSVLENWGGVIVGFYFGAFISLIKDYIKMK